MRRIGREPRRIVLAVTSAQSLRLMAGFPEYLAGEGWDVHVVCDTVPAGDAPGVRYHALPMRRDPAPAHDLVSLLRWISLLIQLRPTVVSAGTPKAGLLGMIAAWLTLVPARIYMLRGLRLATETGQSRRRLAAVERLSNSAATQVVAVSESLRREYLALGLSSPNKVVVVAHGSSNGVLVPASVSDQRDPESFTVGFVGRLHRDKGIDLLLDAASRARTRRVEIRLLLIGPEEPPGILDDLLYQYAPDARDWVVSTGHVPDPERYYPQMDILALLTKREGFPNVVLEAAVHGVPTLASRVTGCVDAIVDGETGVLIDTNDAGSVADALVSLAETDARTRMGARASSRAIELYERRRVWRAYENFYTSVHD